MHIEIIHMYYFKWYRKIRYEIKKFPFSVPKSHKFHSMCNHLNHFCFYSFWLKNIRDMLYH